MVFFINIFPWAKVSDPEVFFAYNFEFAELFESNVDSAMSITLLSQFFVIGNPNFIFCIGLKYRWQYSSPELDLVLLSTKMRAFWSMESWLSDVNDTAKSWLSGVTALGQHWLMTRVNDTAESQSAMFLNMWMAYILANLFCELDV
jgi:hypothetical protein